jgi:hypothetical protein
MPRRVRYWLAVALMTAALAWAGWPGRPANPATLISRVDVVATALILATMPWLVARRFGVVRRGWLPRIVRVVGYLAVVALVLAKAAAERVEYVRAASRPGLNGLWVGEVIFLLVLSAYLAGLLIVTAHRSPVSPAAATTGVLGGIVIGLTIFVVRPLEGPLHTSSAWLTVTYFSVRLAAVPVVFGAAIAVGVAAVRRSSHRGRAQSVGQAPGAMAAPAGPQQVAPGSDARRPTRPPSRARHGVVAGLCAGGAAALLVSLLGLSTVALAPHDARIVQWTLPSRDGHSGSVYEFEVSVTEAAAGYLLVLVLFPLFGAGLGAWGGLYGATKPRRPGGDDGGGPGGPERPRKPPPGGLHLDDDRERAVATLRRILASPEWTGVPSGPQAPGPGSPVHVPDPAAPDRRERTPAGAVLSAIGPVRAPPAHLTGSTAQPAASEIGRLRRGAVRRLPCRVFPPDRPGSACRQGCAASAKCGRPIA